MSNFTRFFAQTVCIQVQVDEKKLFLQVLGRLADLAKHLLKATAQLASSWP
jgi:hypothetical protein